LLAARWSELLIAAERDRSAGVPRRPARYYPWSWRWLPRWWRRLRRRGARVRRRLARTRARHGAGRPPGDLPAARIGSTAAVKEITVAWKDMVNTGLVRTTGYRLTRAQPGGGTGGGSGGGSGKAAGAARKAPRGTSAPVRAKSALPRDFDDEAVRTIRGVRAWTMTSPEKLNALILAVRYVVRHQIPGDVVECGVWRGGSMQAAARTLIACGDTSRDLYLFDTFEGMPPPADEDRRHDGRSAAELLASSSRTANVWAVATLDDVRAGMSQVGYPAAHVHYVPGLVEDTVPERAPEQISILRLDTDWYASTKHELETLYPRLASGGVLLLDDYGWWQGSRKAVDEFLDESGERLLLLRMGSGRIAVKP